MALIRRISRLFAADVHAVLDQIEEPEAVLRQAIREMEEELARQRQRQKSLAQDIDALDRRRAGFDVQMREIDASLDICFRTENDALARRLTRRKLETLRLCEQQAARRETLAAQLAEIVALIALNCEQLEGMQQKAAVLVNDLPGGDGHSGPSAGSIDEDDVEMAFLREKQARVPS